MSHRAHPDKARGDPSDAILWDDCERCADQAENPTGLDRQALRMAWELMHVVESGALFGKDSRRPRYRTGAEARLCRNLNATYIIVERLGGVKANGRPGNV